MIDQKQLMRLLNQSGANSGTALGEALGVSRVAVQKKIQSLIDNGLPINAVPGKGYSLSDGVVLLDEQSILACLENPQAVSQLEVLQLVDSTNSYLLSESISTNKASVCLAEVQGSGRGRRGNDWRSAPYRNVMLSLSWGFDHWPATITGLSLAVALCVTEVLNQHYSLDVKIKWPNDLMVERDGVYDKLGGILVDVAGESSGACNVVIGLGLNVHQPDWSAQEGASYRWHDLHRLGVSADRNQLSARIIDALTAMLSEFSDSGFALMTERWNALSSYAEKMIRVGDESSAVIGRMVGVDSTGALLVCDKQGVEHQFLESMVRVRLVDS